MKIIKSIACFLALMLVIICFTGSKAYSIPLKNNVRMDKIHSSPAASLSFKENADYNNPCNSSGNIINSGIVCESDGYIYFTDGEGLYKRSTEGAPYIKICDDKALYINVSNNSIFYSNCSDNRCIYSINTDGTDRRKITEDSADFITVSDGWIYYTNSDDLKLYRINTDGTEKISISDDKSSFLNIYGNWLYYITEGEQNKAYRINLETMVKEELPVNNVSSIDVSDGYIYYISADDNFCLYKIELNLMDKPLKLTNYGVKYINVSGDWIYFADNKNGAIHRMKTDGRSDMELNTDNSSCINIAGGFIYYYNFNSWPEIYSMKVDGSMKHKIIAEQ